LDEEVLEYLEIDTLMNDKIVGVFQNCRPGELHIIDKTALFTEDGSFAVDRAQLVDPDKRGNAWRRIKLTDNGGGDPYLCLEPGNSGRLAVILGLSPCTLKILNLITGEVICQISAGSRLYPANWWGGSFLFLKDLQIDIQIIQRHETLSDLHRRERESHVEPTIQVVLFDPKQNVRAGSSTMEELEKEGFFLPALEVSCCERVNLSYHLGGGSMIKLDYYGVALADDSTMHIASIVDDAWI
jgi:hypothetical protein